MKYLKVKMFHFLSFQFNQSLGNKIEKKKEIILINFFYVSYLHKKGEKTIVIF